MKKTLQKANVDRIYISIAEGVHRQLCEYCSEKGLTKSAVITASLVQYFNQQELSVLAMNKLLENQEFLDKMQALLVSDSKK